MKRFPLFFFVPFVLLLQTNTLFADTSAQVILLQADNFEHIVFRRIKANHHDYQNQQLQIEVDGSASFLMKPFNRVRQISRVSFAWRSDGRPQINNAQHEKQRAGDDAVFKLGLLLETDNALADTLPNPFLPAWMKRVEKLLKFPSENMIYLVVDAKHAAGEQWINPYNRRVTMVAIDSLKNKQGWRQSSYRFEKPVNVVALWLMSDGDNTNSRFTAYIKNIKIE
jgi:hypothetical protein